MQREKVRRLNPHDKLYRLVIGQIIHFGQKSGDFVEVGFVAH